MTETTVHIYSGRRFTWTMDVEYILRCFLKESLKKKSKGFNAFQNCANLFVWKILVLVSTLTFFGFVGGVVLIHELRVSSRPFRNDLLLNTFYLLSVNQQGFYVYWNFTFYIWNSSLKDPKMNLNSSSVKSPECREVTGWVLYMI